MQELQQRLEFERTLRKKAEEEKEKEVTKIKQVFDDQMNKARDSEAKKSKVEEEKLRLSKLLEEAERFQKEVLTKLRQEVEGRLEAEGLVEKKQTQIVTLKKEAAQLKSKLANEKAVKNKLVKVCQELDESVKPLKEKNLQLLLRLQRDTNVMRALRKELNENKEKVNELSRLSSLMQDNAKRETVTRIEAQEDSCAYQLELDALRDRHEQLINKMERMQTALREKSNDIDTKNREVLHLRDQVMKLMLSLEREGGGDSQAEGDENARKLAEQVVQLHQMLREKEEQRAEAMHENLRKKEYLDALKDEISALLSRWIKSNKSLAKSSPRPGARPELADLKDEFEHRMAERIDKKMGRRGSFILLNDTFFANWALDR